MNNSFKLKSILFLFLLFSIDFLGQAPLYSGVLVSDVGTGNNIGRANTSRNLAISKNGDIYVVYTGSAGIRVAKSINRGQSFLPSVLVSSTNSEPEIVVNDYGEVFVSWLSGGSISLSKSMDDGVTFNTAFSVGSGSGRAVHMSVFKDLIYLIDEKGVDIYSNANRGVGSFLHISKDRHVYADIRTDQNGIVYVPSDNPELFLSKSVNSGVSFSGINITPTGHVNYSSYALSDGPCGTFIFIGGGEPTATQGFKMDVSNGAITPIVLGNNIGNQEGRTLFADNRGTLVDGYINSASDLMINVSYDQGETFSLPIVVANGRSHNVDRNPLHEDIDVVYEQSGQVYLSVYNDLLKNIRISKEDFPGLCPGNVIDLPFTLSGNFSPTTLFSAYLSDSSGSFENKTLIGSITTNSSGNIVCTIPTDVSYGEFYRLQIESQENCSQSNAITFAIGAVQINKPLDLIACDDDKDGFFENFDTTLVEEQLLNGQNDLIVTYFDGNGNVLPSPLPNPYTNRVFRDEVITIRVARPLANCFSETTLDLKVLDIPVINKPNNLYSCNEGNGVAGFDTSVVESQIIGSQNNLRIHYFDENNIELPSPLPATYQNTTPWMQTIRVLVENELNTSCYQETSFDLVVNELPQINLESEYLLCDLEPMLNLSSDSSLDQWEWVYQDGTIVSNSFDAGLIEEGDYVLKVGKIENGILCENSFSFTMVRSELPTIQDIRSQDLSDDNFIEIIATGDGDFEYSIDGINYQDSNLFEDLLGGIYIATVRDKFGCGEDSIKVTLIDYPKYFTPNNDGENDYWQIKGITGYPAARIFIYNRYGKLLKQISPNETGWDGTYGGVLMAETDFWFTVRLDNENSFKGHFSLKI